MIQKVQPGQKIRGNFSAAAFNAMAAAAEAYAESQHDMLPGSSSSLVTQSGVISVKNTSGSDRARFDVLGIESPVFTPAVALDAFKNSVTVTGTTPTTATHAGRFVVLLEPVANNAIGRAVVAGAVPVQLTIDSDSDKFADVNDGQCGSLKSVKSGAAAILWKAASSGTIWAIIRIGAGGGDSVRYGRYIARVSPTNSNLLTIRPCNSSGVVIDATGAGDIVAAVCLPLAQQPAVQGMVANALLAYQMLPGPHPDDNRVVAILTATNLGLPAVGTEAQVLETKNGVWVAGWARWGG